MKEFSLGQIVFWKGISQGLRITRQGTVIGFTGWKVRIFEHTGRIFSKARRVLNNSPRSRSTRPKA